MCITFTLHFTFYVLDFTLYLYLHHDACAFRFVFWILHFMFVFCNLRRAVGARGKVCNRPEWKQVKWGAEAEQELRKFRSDFQTRWSLICKFLPPSWNDEYFGIEIKANIFVLALFIIFVGCWLLIAQCSKARNMGECMKCVNMNWRGQDLCGKTSNCSGDELT